MTRLDKKAGTNYILFERTILVLSIRKVESQIMEKDTPLQAVHIRKVGWLKTVDKIHFNKKCNQIN